MIMVRTEHEGREVVFVSRGAIETLGIELLRDSFPQSDLVTGDPNDSETWVAAK